MARTTIETERLTLRPLVMADAPEIARQIGDIAVSGWLTVVPHPYSIADAEDFIRTGDPACRYCIETDGQVIGVVSANAQLGYWLGKSHWGNGYMGEAVRAVIANWFAHGGGDIGSGYFLGNKASKRILSGVGFRPTLIEQTICVATGQKNPLQKMCLNRADWQAKHG